MTRAIAPPENQEASRDVVIDAVSGPEDRSGPCRSVKHRISHLGSNNQKGQDLPMKRVGHPLPSAGIGLDDGWFILDRC